MADLQEFEGHDSPMSILAAADNPITGQAISRFKQLAEEAGYDLDPFRMAFGSLAISALCRADLTPNEVARTIQAIRDTASLMGVDSNPVARKSVSHEAEQIIDAINPKIEGLLEAIERGKHASEAFDGRTETTATAYESVQE